MLQVVRTNGAFNNCYDAFPLKKKVAKWRIVDLKCAAKQDCVITSYFFVSLNIEMNF